MSKELTSFDQSQLAGIKAISKVIRAIASEMPSEHCALLDRQLKEVETLSKAVAIMAEHLFNTHN